MQSAKELIYCGVGSRKTPPAILKHMEDIGKALADKWTLRSGGADGADTAFEQGCIAKRGKKEIFLPWAGFNRAPRNHPDYIVPRMSHDLWDYASHFHPAWDRCSQPVQRLFMRNVCQVLGLDLLKPAKVLICWTPNGSGTGGTGHTIRVARANRIPVFDLGKDSLEDVYSFIESC